MSDISRALAELPQQQAMRARCFQPNHLAPPFVTPRTPVEFADAALAHEGGQQDV